VLNCPLEAEEEEGVYDEVEEALPVYGMKEEEEEEEAVAVEEGDAAPEEEIEVWAKAIAKIVAMITTKKRVRDIVGGSKISSTEKRQ